MRSVRQRDTPAERMLRRALWSRGVRYRLQRRIAGTRPDIVIGRGRVAVFVDGCFWHGCPRHYTAPRNNADFWRRKVEGNRARDRRNDETLRLSGWLPIRIWECELRADLAAVITRIEAALG